MLYPNAVKDSVDKQEYKNSIYFYHNKDAIILDDIFFT